MSKWIAERKFLVESIETSDRFEVTFRVGQPYWAEGDEDAACPRELVGIFDEMADARGVDPVHALQLALDIDTMIEALKDKYCFFWLSGERYEVD